MRGIMKAQGAKPKPIKKAPHHEFFDPLAEEELPLVTDIIAMLGGQGTVNG